MRTVGEILKATRLEKKYSLDFIEKEIKIRFCYLEAIEANDFLKIPGGGPITKGFIKNYSEFLDLSAETLLAVFRRDFQEDKKGQIVPRGMVKPLNENKFFWSPKLTAIFSLSLFLIIFISFVVWQAISLVGAPSLKIEQPKNNLTTSEESIEVSGKADKDATVLINGENISLDEDGFFKKEIKLLPGENKIIFEAVSRKGKRTAQDKIVNLIY